MKFETDETNGFILVGADSSSGKLVIYSDKRFMVYSVDELRHSPNKTLTNQYYKRYLTEYLG
jgi:hypothetical protein